MQRRAVGCPAYGAAGAHGRVLVAVVPVVLGFRS
jgi:hypothetical protein